MSTIDPQLLQQIVERVIAQMSGGATERAAIKPPIGTCTAGDAQPTVAAPAPAEPVDKAQPQLEIQPVGLSGIITARQIQAIGGGVVHLTANAKLTALAADLVRERGLKIERVYGQLSAGKRSAWLWWMHGSCPAVPGIVADHAADMLASGARDLLSAVREVAVAVKAGRAAGGVLFVPSAAIAACYANRCGVLRAAVAACPKAVEEACQTLGANVLVVPYPFHDAQRMATMVNVFLKNRQPVTAEVERQLKELSSCG